MHCTEVRANICQTMSDVAPIMSRTRRRRLDRRESITSTISRHATRLLQPAAGTQCHRRSQESEQRDGGLVSLGAAPLQNKAEPFCLAYLMPPILPTTLVVQEEQSVQCVRARFRTISFE